MKRVLLVGPHLSRQGGVANHIRTLLNSPLRKHYILDYFRVGGITKSGVLKTIITSLFTPFRFLLRILLHRPDVVHLNPSFDYKSLIRELSLVLVSKILQIPTVVQLHGGDLDRVKRHGKMPYYLKLFFNSASHFIVLTRLQRKPLLDYLDSSRITVIPNMIDSAKYDKPKSRSARDIHIIFLSRMEAEKGIFDLYQAIPKIIAQHPHAHFSFAGDGKDRQNLQDMCRTTSSNGNITFKGYIANENKINFLLSGDIFVLPTHHKEGMPYSILEAMAAGLPVITTTNGAIPEIINDHENGFLIPHGKPDLLYEKINELIKNPDLLNQFSANNRKAAITIYDINVVTKKFSKVYENTIESK